MPWIYLLELSEYKDAETVESDWVSIASEGVAHKNGGTCVGQRATGAIVCVVSTPREPNYEDMASSFDYVESVSEEFEIPSDEVAHLEVGGVGTHPMS